MGGSVGGRAPGPAGHCFGLGCVLEERLPVKTPHLLVALMLILVTAVAVAAPSQAHRAWSIAAVQSLPTYFEDREAGPEKAAQLVAIGNAVAEFAIPPAGIPRKEWAALVLAVGYSESTYSLRIHRGECRLEKKECDAKRLKNGELVARAKSPWQMHENLFTRDTWSLMTGIENTDVQVIQASAMLQRGFHTCSRAGVPWQVAAVNGYAGRRCDAQWRGLGERLATQARLMRVVVKKETSLG